MYFDGIILVPGDNPQIPPPKCSDVDCEQVSWGEVTFQNLIQNSSVEKSWLSLSMPTRKIIARFNPITDPTITLSSLLNWQTNQGYLIATAKNLVRTFWAKFGWGHVSLMGSKPYRILAIITGIMVIAAFIRLIRLRKSMPWPIIAFFAITLLLIWGAALLRGLTSIRWLSNFVYIPVARYAYPAIIPTVLLLNLGWLELSDQGNHWFQIPKNLFYATYLIFFIFLNLLSILSIYNFYYIS